MSDRHERTNPPSPAIVIRMDDIMDRIVNPKIGNNDWCNQLQKDDDIPHQVLILRGGFTEFQEKSKVACTELFAHLLTY
jgi:hypothetical protein